MGLPTHDLKEQKMTKATYSNSKDPKQKHRFKNLLLQPVIQLRIAAWSAFASAIFGFAIALVFYYSLRSISNAFADIGHLDDETITNAYQMFEWIRISALTLLVSQVFVSIAVSLVTTHRLVGPTVAMRRQIRAMINGQYGQKITVRDTDAFTDMAEDLNELSEQLSKENRKQPASTSDSVKSSRAINE